MAFFSESRLCICNRIVNLKVPNASTAICQCCYFSIAFICARDYLFRLNYFKNSKIVAKINFYSVRWLELPHWTCKPRRSLIQVSFMIMIITVVGRLCWMLGYILVHWKVTSTTTTKNESLARVILEHINKCTSFLQPLCRTKCSLIL